MNLKNIMRDLLKCCGTNSRELSVNMGHDASYIAVMLSRATTTVDTLAAIADALGYEVVLRPKRSPSKRVRHPEEFVLEYVDPNDPVPESEEDDDEEDDDEKDEDE